MGKNKKATGKRVYVGTEPGLQMASKNYICWDKLETHRTKVVVESIVRKIIEAMKKQSSTFARLYVKNFGAGSSYEGLKVGKPEEFDIDILLKLPEETRPVLKEDTIPGFVQLQLTQFDKLASTKPELHRDMKKFVDAQNYLLTTEMKSTFLQSIFDKTLNTYFPKGALSIGSEKYKIARVQTLGPAFTLTIEGLGTPISLDLVPCILLTGVFWPKGGFRSNPYSAFTKLQEFFIVPKEPKREHPHLERYWRLSFQIQERRIIFNRFWMKPTIRILKRMRDCLNHHNISSYAIKTVFMWELLRENPALDQSCPDLFKSALSYCVVYMLERYLKCLRESNIPYFWNAKLNLLDNLTQQQIDHYRDDVERMIEDIKKNPDAETVLKYLA